MPEWFPRASEVSIDFRVLGFTLLISVLTGLLFGLAPAFLTSRLDPIAGFRVSASSRFRIPASQSLAVLEISLSLMLLAGAGLLIRSFWTLRQVELGFRPERLLTLKLSVPESRFTTGGQLAAHFREILRRVETLPGVEAAGAASSIPLGGGIGLGVIVEIEGRPKPPREESAGANLRLVSTKYFRTIGIPLLQGRYFQESDHADAPPVAIISPAIASRFFPGENLIGQRLTLPVIGASLHQVTAQDVPHEIVGVVADAKNASLDEKTSLDIYVPMLQSCAPYTVLVIRTKADSSRLASTVEREIRNIDKDQPVAEMRTMEGWVAATLGQRRWNMLALGVFATVALLLAACGIFAVTAYSVSRRTQEFGIRMALRAQPEDVVRLVMRQVLRVTALGMTIGWLGALVLGRVISGLLYGVSSKDPWTFAAVSLVLLGVASLAGFLPALKATQVDPIVALKE